MTLRRLEAFLHFDALFRKKRAKNTFFRKKVCQKMDFLGKSPQKGAFF